MCRVAHPLFFMEFLFCRNLSECFRFCVDFVCHCVYGVRFRTQNVRIRTLFPGGGNCLSFDY